MCPSAPRVCSEHGGEKPVLSLSLDLIDRDQPEPARRQMFENPIHIREGISKGICKNIVGIMILAQSSCISEHLNT